MDVCWRPYCNRNGDIYYINMKEQRAYLAHPVDIQTKRKYAQKKGRPVPKFNNYPLEAIAKSMKLVQEEI